MATTHNRVTLTVEHRDAIYEEILSVVRLTDDIPLYFADAEFDPDDRDDLRDIVDRLSVAVRLLEQLGWERRGASDCYELDVDPGIARFMARLERHSRDALREDAEPVKRIMAGCYELSDEEFADEVESRRKLVDVDLDGIDAARLILAALHHDDDEAVA